MYYAIQTHPALKGIATMEYFPYDACLVMIQAFKDPKTQNGPFYQNEFVAPNKDAALALLDKLVTERRADGMTVTYAAAHTFRWTFDGRQRVVYDIESYHRIFEIREPYQSSAAVGIRAYFENPTPEWKKAAWVEVAGTDSEGDGWFLRYHEVVSGKPWPEDTIHVPGEPSKLDAELGNVLNRAIERRRQPSA